MKRSRRHSAENNRKRPGKNTRERARTTTTAGSSTMPDTFTGELRMHRDGYGFVVADRLGVEDVFVPAPHLINAMHTDIVEVRVLPGRGGRFEGRVLRVVERRMKRVVGRLEQAGKAYRVVASDNRVRRQVLIPQNALHGARHNQDVVALITEYPEGDQPMRGEVERVIAERGSLGAEEQVIIAQHQLPIAFPAEVEAEARAIHAKGVTSEGRRDLTDIPFITIDGESARDFDDAVAVRRVGEGTIRLWVSIADVSHYVTPGSAIDREAYARGTSVYFPRICLPMLPEALSNELCSLKADCPRLTLTAELDIAPDGTVIRRVFYRSVITSRRRMTYTEIKKILIDKDRAVTTAHEELVPGIRLMQECFDRLRAKRLARGSLDFDLPEPEIVIDLSGDIENIVRAERHVGHMMIEEFMIAANEAVAEFLTESGRGCIYRVHEAPKTDKLKEFSMFAHNLGLNVHLGANVPPKNLARVIEQVRGKPEERLVNHKLLRSMAQAVYSPENIGHYGLASTCYCHFTSPIRRYPDLVVHRLMTAILEQGSVRMAALAGIAEHCSRRERVAMTTERETAKLYASYFMRDRIGEEFEGVIAHIAKFGFFVELEKFFVEGVVYLASMEDDFYRFDEQGMRLVGRKGKEVLRIGDRVKVVVEDVNVLEREVVFVRLPA